MIQQFDQMARFNPDKVFFRFAAAASEDAAAVAGGDATVAADGSIAVTYRQTRLRAAALMRSLERDGYASGSLVACDMDNCPAFIYLILACAYGRFTLVTLNHRLTDDGKLERLLDISLANGLKPCVTLTEADVLRLVGGGLRAEREAALVHQAQRAAALAVREDEAVVMFTSGTTGKAKAAKLSGRALCGSAEAFNVALGSGDDVVWQVVLPLYHIGGFQMVIRSVLNGTSFVLYRRFDAQRILFDARLLHATHLSVVDKMLRDVLDVPDGADTLRAYRCILLGGAAPNAQTLQRAVAAHARVFSGYGMTETSSAVATCLVGEGASDELSLLPGYEACIIAPDIGGVGQLGIKGPGVFDGYLDASAPFTADGFFMTGDTARMAARRIVISERTEDMFVSGGENIYPAEIRAKILQIPGVTDAYVFGEPDETWGRRPVALVEMVDAQVDGTNAVQLANRVRLSLEQRIARIYRPDRLFVMGEFPRKGIGKIDRQALEVQARQCLNVKKVELHLIEQPFVTPVVTAKATLAKRASLLVKVTDGVGRTGVGEDAAFATSWYLPEIIDEDRAYLEKQLIPCVLVDAYLQPDDVYGALIRCPGADEHPMAVAALETALWDLYGKVVGVSLRELIGARDNWDGEGLPYKLPKGVAPGGAVIGLLPIEQTVEAAKEAVAQGYLRVKLKIAPGNDVERVAAVRKALPGTMLVLDANQSYCEDDREVLHALDRLDCACIEEPLDPQRLPKVGPKDLFARLARLQRSMSTLICLDESIVTREDALRAFDYPDLRGFVLKIGKFGGIWPALEFFWRARARGVRVWMGGMYDTGVGKRLHAAFSLLPGVTLPGDVNDASRYFAVDVTDPPLVLEHGGLQVNPPQAPHGVGCTLNCEALATVETGHWTFE